MEKTLLPLNNYADMKYAIEKAGAWFIGAFMGEFIENYRKFQDKKTKKDFIVHFMNEYTVTDDINQLRNRINLAIRIIESDMVVDAMKFVIDTADEKIGTIDAKINAKELLEEIESGEVVLPVFEN